MRLQLDAPFRDSGASTGPRPEGRGDIGETGVGKTKIGASTGPRPEGRGDTGNWAGVQPGYDGLQRGRAPRGAEMTKPLKSEKSLRSSFNGAAPRGARR